MAQEQAKSPGATVPGAKDQSPNPLEAMTRAREEKSGDAPILERGLDIPKRTTLAERLKAEQRKREGGAVEQKSREAIFSNPEHPYTQMLLSSVLTPEPGLGLPELAPH